MIARVKVTVKFKNRKIPAGPPKNTQGMLQSQCRPGRFLEQLDDDPPDVLPHPLVKDRAEKNAKGIRRHGSGAHPTCGGRLRLNQRDEAQILRFDLLEKAVDRKRMLDILRVDNTQDIDGDVVPPQKAISLHHLPVGRLPAFGHAIAVVQLLRAIETEPDGKAFRREEAAPFLIEEHAVRLDAIGDAPLRGPVLPLQVNDLAKIVQPEKGRLPPVPEEVDDGIGGDFDLLNDVLFQQVTGHMERRGLGVEQSLLQVVTIVAVKVAARARGFDKDLKFEGCFGHGPFFLCAELILG